MCHPDVSSLTTFFWDIEERPKVNGTKTLNKCVDWNAMMSSMKDRFIAHDEMKAIKRPEKLET